MSADDTFYSQYEAFLSDAAEKLTEAQGFCGIFLGSEHCTDADGIREEITRHYYLCAGAARYLREAAPAALQSDSPRTLN